MTPRVIVVTSGKGGVGKTTTSASLASGLAARNFPTVVIDFDVGLRNLDLIMGCENRVVYDLINVINGEARLKQALIKDKNTENLYILPASQTRDKDCLTPEGVKRVLDELKSMGFMFIVCDSPAGIERGAVMALRFADDAIVVTNPEISSMRDSDRIVGLIDSKSDRAEQDLKDVRKFLLVTRYDANRVAKGEMMSYQDVQDYLKLTLMGVIPESDAVLTSSNAGHPVILQKELDASQAYWDALERYFGNEMELRFVQPKKQGIFGRIMGGSK